MKVSKTGCSSFGNCTSLRLRVGAPQHRTVVRLQFLWELHFIEAGASAAGMTSPAGCSSFGNCTSLRQPDRRGNEGQQDRLQFLWELHFIEALLTSPRRGDPWLQFLWELHFIEASRPVCVPRGRWLQFLWELHFIEAGYTKVGQKPCSGWTSEGEEAQEGARAHGVIQCSGRGVMKYRLRVQS